MNIVVYTAIFGSIGDELQPLPEFPAWFDDRVKYIAYVDDVANPVLDSTGWERRPALWVHRSNPRLRARRHKILAHQLFPKADVSIWIDGCLTPAEDPAELAKKYLVNHDICVFEHMQRDCVYAEAAACKRLRKDSVSVIDALVARYQREGYPPKRGLGETTCVMRRHTPAVNKFSEEWWEELRAHSIRDQLSFDYLIWKHGLAYQTFQGARTNNPHFTWIPHR